MREGGEEEEDEEALGTNSWDQWKTKIIGPPFLASGGDGDADGDRDSDEQMQFGGAECTGLD